MKNSIKGAIAAGGAAVILLGGAGSLAYWNDIEDIAGGNINSGQLEIDATDCDGAVFTVENTVEKVLAGSTFDIGVDRVVPGDKLTKTCDVDIIAVGQNLRASLTYVGTEKSESLAPFVTVTPTFLIGASQVNEITDQDVNKTVTATLVVDFPIGAAVDNNSQQALLTVAKSTITATQATTSAP